MSHASQLAGIAKLVTLFFVILLTSCTSPLNEGVSGRLLLYQGTVIKSGELSYTFKRSVWEIKGGAARPRRLFDLPPVSTSFDWFYSQPIAVSFNGHYAVFEPGYFVNLMTGDIDDLPIPENPTGIPITNASFSPDNRYLAYTVEGRVYVFDIDTRESRTIFKGPCAWYGPGGRYPAGVKCGEIGLPLWFDSNTLAFNYFNGEMPYVYDIAAVLADSLAVRTVSGETVITLDERLNVYDDQFIYDQYWDQQSSSTIIVGWPPDINWLDTSDLLQGNINLRPINIDRPYYLLPGGQYLLQSGQPWRLIELRTGTISPLGTHYNIASFQRCVWSPDQTSVACICYEQVNGKNAVLLIVPLSDSVEEVVMNWEDQSWYLLTWVP